MNRGENSILLLDIGNSSITWKLSVPQEEEQNQNQIKARQNEAQGRAEDIATIAASLSVTAPFPVADALPVIPKEVRFACVRQEPEGSGYWAKKIRNQWGPGVEPQLAQVREGCHGLKPAYLTSLGVDRWLGLLALQVAYAGPSQKDWLLIDAGTARTMDLLSDGQHLGGLIAPGTESIRQALLKIKNTGTTTFKKNALNEQTNNQAGWGKDTASCLELGLYLMQEDFVVGRILDFLKTFKEGNVMFTGGGGEALFKSIRSRLPQQQQARLRYDSHLVCKGLLYAFDF